MAPIDEHSCTVTFGTDTVGPIVGGLVALGAPFTLDADEEVREHLRTAGRWLLDAGGQPSAPPTNTVSGQPKP